MQSKKKIVAAIAAVTYYIQAEEEILCMQAAMAAPESDQRPSAAPTAAVNVWGMAGRQAQMQMRSLMQARAFK